MNQPRVSVIIPVYNGQRHLAETLDHVLAQTWPNVEVVAVNDGSTDGSADILASFADRVVRIDQANAGVGAARNAGIARATGDLIAFLDQDDWWRPEKLEKQLALFLADDGIGLVHTAVDYYDHAAGRFVGPLNPEARPELLVGDCFDRLLVGNAIVNSSVVVRRSVLQQTGGCSLEVRGNTCQDFDLWVRVARTSLLGFVSEPMTVFRMHGDQGTWDRRKMLTEELGVIARAATRYTLSIAGPLRRRIAAIHEELGVAHLDAEDPVSARGHFAAALRLAPSRRRAMLVAASLLPAGVVRRLREVRSQSKKTGGRRLGEEAVPS